MIKKNRSILYISFTILVIIVALVYFLFVWMKNDMSVKENQFKNGMIVSFNSSQHMNIKNILPMSDELGVSLDNKSVERGGYGYIKFSIKNRNAKKTEYKIYIMKSNYESNTINDRYIKFYLTDENNNAVEGYDKENVLNYNDLLALSSKPLGRLIYSGSLEANEERYFILRSWLSDEYMLKDESESFDFDIFAESK